MPLKDTRRPAGSKWYFLMRNATLHLAAGVKCWSSKVSEWKEACDAGVEIASRVQEPYRDARGGVLRWCWLDDAEGRGVEGVMDGGRDEGSAPAHSDSPTSSHPSCPGSIHPSSFGTHTNAQTQPFTLTLKFSHATAYHRWLWIPLCCVLVQNAAMCLNMFN